MHQVPPYESAVTLFSRDGEVEVFKSMKAALKALGLRWIEDNVGPHFRVFRYVERRFDTQRALWVADPLYDNYRYILRNDQGEPVTAADFAVFRRQRPWRGSWALRYAQWNGEGPVPGTRCRRGGRHYYRHPRTMHERRQAALVLEEEGEVAPRPHRSANSLPCAWDDFRVAARDDRNWKRFRRTQWRA